MAGLYIALYWGRLFLADTPLADEIAFAVGAWASRAATLLSSSTGVAVLLIGATALAGLVWVLTIVTGRQRRLSRQNEHTPNWKASGEHRHGP